MGTEAPAPGGRKDSGWSYAVARAPEIRRLLLGAYHAGKRDLPWRGESDPYKIWISEVMLQQTRVETVIPYYKEWVKRFPNVEALASADEEEVLRAWQGLGYYSRARNLHGAAKVVKETLGGALPASSTGLRALPGVGEYTAGAIASIAFGGAVPAVDGNVRRVLSRLFDLPAPGPAELRKLAEALVDPASPGEFNQALMELGSQLCTPQSPGCKRCPIRSLCLAHERGSVGARPGRRTRKPPKEVDVAVLVPVAVGEKSPRFLLRKRPAKGLLAGMWEFPSVPVGAGEEARRVALATARKSGIRPEDSLPEQEMDEEALFGKGSGDSGAGPEAPCHALDPVVHVFTHLKARYHPFLFRVDEEIRLPQGGKWVSLRESEDLPLPVAQGKILAAAVEAVEGERGRAPSPVQVGTGSKTAQGPGAGASPYVP